MRKLPCGLVVEGGDLGADGRRVGSGGSLFRLKQYDAARRFPGDRALGAEDSTTQERRAAGGFAGGLETAGPESGGAQCWMRGGPPTVRRILGTGCGRAESGGPESGGAETGGPESGGAHPPGCGGPQSAWPEYGGSAGNGAPEC